MMTVTICWLMTTSFSAPPDGFDPLKELQNNPTSTVPRSGPEIRMITGSKKLEEDVILSGDSSLARWSILQPDQAVRGSKGPDGKNAPRQMMGENEPLKENFTFPKGTRILKGTILGSTSVIQSSGPMKLFDMEQPPSTPATVASKSAAAPPSDEEEQMPEKPKEEEDPESPQEEQPKAQEQQKKVGNSPEKSAEDKMADLVKDARRHEARLWEKYSEEMSPVRVDHRFEYYEQSNRHPSFRFEPTSGKVWEWQKVGGRFTYVDLSPKNSPQYWCIRVGRITYVFNGEIIYSETLPHLIVDRGRYP